MAYYQDLREYMAALEEHGKLTRIKREINKDTELHPLVRLEFRGLPDAERTAFLFENVTDSRGKKYAAPVLVGALAASSQIYALGMMCQPDEIAEKHTQAELRPIEPRVIERGPVQEEVHVGDKLLEHGGLGEFPIPVTTPGYDVAPYITAPCFVTKDPETGVPNVGMYRAMVKSPTRTGVMFSTPVQGTLIHWRKCRERGIPLEAAIVIGGAPNILYVSVSKLPVGVDEYGVAGGIAGEPVKLVKCKTVNIEVPAAAEIVIEGEISTTELEPEAPFGEALGFVGAPEMMPFFTVRCITHRKKPVWLATMSQYPPTEGSLIRQYPNEGTLLKHLRYDLKMEHVLGVAFYDELGSTRFMTIKLKRTEPAEVWRTLEAAANRFPRVKVIVAVDEDVNIRDMDSVNLAICMRTQPHRDFRIVKVPAPSQMDYSCNPPDELPDLLSAKPEVRNAVEASRVMIDATMKWSYPPLSLPKKEFMDRALRIWQEEGLPRLKLKEPWWGVNLGWWSGENDELAMAATKGDHFKAGDLYARRRRAVSP